MSAIVAATTAAILDVFAGQTVTHEAVGEQIELQYTMARKRTAFGSFIQIYRGLENAGVRSFWTGTDMATSELLYTFPHRAI